MLIRTVTVRYNDCTHYQWSAWKITNHWLAWGPFEARIKDTLSVLPIVKNYFEKSWNYKYVIFFSAPWVSFTLGWMSWKFDFQNSRIGCQSSRFHTSKINRQFRKISIKNHTWSLCQDQYKSKTWTSASGESTIQDLGRNVNTEMSGVDFSLLT